MIFIDYPRYCTKSEYENAITHMVDTLKSIDGIIAIYQLGSTGQPGISDIDMLAVFNESVSYKGDPRATLSKKEKYLFSHGLYGLSEKHISGVTKYGFFFQPKLLWGGDIFLQDTDKLEKDDFKILKNQIALEYLLKMYINTLVEQTYRIVKVRSLLLQAKALILDLNLLDIEDCSIRKLLNKIVDWRESWFDSQPNKSALNSWLREFHKEFPLFIGGLLRKYSFYLQNNGKLHLADNIEIRYSEELSVFHRGFISNWFGIFGRKYFNLLHRVNQFIIYLPFQSKNIPKIIMDSQEYFISNKQWLEKNVNCFMPLSSSLNIH